MISFVCFSPHPPIILPSVGSEKDRAQVKNTIKSLERLGEKLKQKKPDSIIISSPHPDWGFNVPLFYLAEDFKGEIKSYLIGIKEPESYFEEGKKMYQNLDKDKNYALVGSGDLSHCLKEDGPYGFNPQGPKFDKELIESLKNKNIENILKLDEKYPEAGECGLRSFSFILGILQASDLKWNPKILSYEGTFGVGYLVADFEL